MINKFDFQMTQVPLSHVLQGWPRLQCSVGSVSACVRELAGLIPGSGIFFHLLSVMGERMSTEY